MARWISPEPSGGSAKSLPERRARRLPQLASQPPGPQRPDPSQVRPRQLSWSAA
jgi:hypothetical protein